jgi:hypothetical protein
VNSGNEEYRLLGCYAKWLLYETTFRRNVGLYHQGSCHLGDGGAIFFDMSVITTVTRRNIPEDGTVHSHRHENLKSYIALTGWVL